MDEFMTCYELILIVLFSKIEAPAFAFPTIQSSKNNIVASKTHIHFWAPSKKVKEIPETDFGFENHPATKKNCSLITLFPGWFRPPWFPHCRYQKMSLSECETVSTTVLSGDHVSVSVYVHVHMHYVYVYVYAYVYAYANVYLDVYVYVHVYV